MLRSPLILFDPDGKQIGINNQCAYCDGGDGPAEIDDYGPIPGNGGPSSGRNVTSESFSSSTAIEPGAGTKIRPSGSSDFVEIPLPNSTPGRTTWVVQSLKGNASELNLGKLDGMEVTKESTKLLLDGVKSFLKDIPEKIDYKSKYSRIKLGNLERLGKEVRIGRDKSEPFQHIDIERNVTGKKYKDLKIKIMTNPLKL